MAKVTAIVGRILIATIFVVSGASKLVNAGATELMIQRVGLPAGLAVPTGMFELTVGLFLAIGLMTRAASLLLIGFVLLVTLFFHNQFTDPQQMVQILKNLALTGGLLTVFGFAHISARFESMQSDREIEQAEHEALERTLDAEVRAARAEGAAYGLSQTERPQAPRPSRFAHR